MSDLMDMYDPDIENIANLYNDAECELPAPPYIIRDNRHPLRFTQPRCPDDYDDCPGDNFPVIIKGGSRVGKISVTSPGRLLKWIGEFVKIIKKGP